MRLIKNLTIICTSLYLFLFTVVIANYYYAVILVFIDARIVSLGNLFSFFSYIFKIFISGAEYIPYVNSVILITLIIMLIIKRNEIKAELPKKYFIMIVVCTIITVFLLSLILNLMGLPQ